MQSLDRGQLTADGLLSSGDNTLKVVLGTGVERNTNCDRRHMDSIRFRSSSVAAGRTSSVGLFD